MTAKNDMEHFNRLTPAEAERLALLAEECGEVIQAIGKVLRHGFESTHPDGGPTNREALEREMGDVYHAMVRMWGTGDLDWNAVTQRADDKARSVVRYFHHQGHNVELTSGQVHRPESSEQSERGFGIPRIYPGEGCQEIDRLNAAMLTAARMLEQDGDEISVGYALRRAMTPNVEIT